jgi:hypothetical protein
LFLVDTSLNVIYLATGIVALGLAMARETVIRGYFQLVATVYVVWAILGLFAGSGQVLGFINNNGWDVALNAVIALTGMIYGSAEVIPGVTAPGSPREAMGFGEFQDRNRRR